MYNICSWDNIATLIKNYTKLIPSGDDKKYFNIFPLHRTWVSETHSSNMCVSCNRCSSGDLKNLRFCVWSHNFEPGDLLWTTRFLIFKMYLKCWFQSLMPLLQTDKQAMPDKHILLVMVFSKDENIVNYFFSCPEQLNRWPCHWLTHSLKTLLIDIQKTI